MIHIWGCAELIVLHLYSWIPLFLLHHEMASKLDIPVVYYIKCLSLILNILRFISFILNFVKSTPNETNCWRIAAQTGFGEKSNSNFIVVFAHSGRVVVPSSCFVAGPWRSRLDHHPWTDISYSNPFILKKICLYKLQFYKFKENLACVRLYCWSTKNLFKTKQ